MKSLRLASGVISSSRRWSGVLKFSMSTLPVEPVSFNNAFAIDRGGNKKNTGFHIDRSKDGPLLLETKNPHEMDSRIQFNEDTHEYYFEGKLLENTCTGLVTQFFEKFDADLTISKMITGNNWPRAGYMYPNGEPYKPEDIKRQWDRTSEFAMNYGAWMHYNIERSLNSLRPSEKLVEMSQFKTFEKLWITDQNVTPLRTEWKVAAPEWSLGGTIDFVGQKSDGSYVIMDWKRSLKLEANLTNKFNKKALPPLEHIDDCDGSKYFLQLNLYKHILEKKYNITVSSMVLASFHAKSEHYLAVEVPDMGYEIVRILDTLKSEQETANSAE